MAGPQGLDFQNAAVKFTKGLDTFNQKKLVLPGQWNKLDNLTLTEDGTPQRRDGVTSLVSGRTGNGLATWNDQMLAVSGGDVFSVSKTLGTAPQVTGTAGYVGVSKEEVSRGVSQKLSIDCAIGSTNGSSSNNLAAYVWTEMNSSGATPAGVYCSVVDQATGTFLLKDQLVRASATVAFPRVVFCANAMNAGGTFYFLYTEPAQLYCSTVLASSPTTLNAEVALVNSVNFNAVAFDCCAFGTSGGNTTAMVVYGWDDGITSVRTIQVNQAAGVPAVAAGPTNIITQAAMGFATLQSLAAVTDGTLGYGLAVSTAGIFASTINTSWVLQTAANPFGGAFAPPVATAVVGMNSSICAVKRTSDSRIQIFWDFRSSTGGADSSDPLYTAVLNSALAVFDGPHVSAYSSNWNASAVTDCRGPRGPYILGKPFIDSSNNVFLPVCIFDDQATAATSVTTHQQNTVFVLECNDTSAASSALAPPVARALYGTWGGAMSTAAAGFFQGGPCSSPADGGAWVVGAAERSILTSSFLQSQAGVVALYLTPNTASAVSKAQLGESTFLAGGVVGAYDGSRISEHPFLMFPEGINVEVVAGGGAMTAGTHQIVAIYELIDNSGQRHQSAPSLATSGTTALNDRLRVRVPTLHMTQWGTELRVVLFSTQAAGLTFTRVAEATAGLFGAANDPTVREVTMMVADADATFASNEALYTQPNLSGTTLPNLAPAPCSAVCVHQGRLFLDKADQPFAYGFSQTQANNIGLQFNDGLGGRWPADGGTFRGWATLDEKVILFAARKPYVIYGTGPNAAGAFSNYSDPQEIQSDVGCSDPRSILKMPQGVIFKSPKGFYMLGRDLSVRYIGEGVAEFDSYTITSATLLEDRHECRFSTNNSAHPTLIYSYLGEGQWSTTSFQDTYTMRDALWWPTQGQYVAIDGTYGVQTDWSSSFKYDNFNTAKAIIWTARTSFLRLTDIGGFQRVRWALLTGTSETTNPMGGNSPQSDLAWTIYLNDVYETASYTFTVDLNTISFASPLEALDLRHKLQTQKCKSIAFQWVDTPSTANAQSGYQVDGIQALTLEVGMRRGLLRLPAAQGVG